MEQSENKQGLILGLDSMRAVELFELHKSMDVFNFVKFWLYVVVWHVWHTGLQTTQSLQIWGPCAYISCLL